MECPNCGGVFEEHDPASRSKCVKEFSEKAGAKVTLDFALKNGLGRVAPSEPCPTCNKPIGEHTVKELFACSKEGREEARSKFLKD